MKRHYNLIIVILVLPILSGCFPLGIGVPPASVPIHDLLVDVSVYPHGWEQTSLLRNEYNIDNDVENINISLRYTIGFNNVSNHFIWRFPSKEYARNGFDLLLKQDRLHEPKLVDSREILYTSTIAQQTNVRCETTSEHLLCSILTQYGAYVSEFTAYIDNSSMNRTEIIHILNEIDRKMAPVASDK